MGGRKDRDQVGQGSFQAGREDKQIGADVWEGGHALAPSSAAFGWRCPGDPQETQAAVGTPVPFCGGDIIPWRLCLGQRCSPWSTPVLYATPRMRHCQDLTVCAPSPGLLPACPFVAPKFLSRLLPPSLNRLTLQEALTSSCPALSPLTPPECDGPVTQPQSWLVHLLQGLDGCGGGVCGLFWGGLGGLSPEHPH